MTALTRHSDGSPSTHPAFPPGTVTQFHQNCRIYESLSDEVSSATLFPGLVAALIGGRSNRPRADRVTWQATVNARDLLFGNKLHQVILSDVIDIKALRGPPSSKHDIAGRLGRGDHQKTHPGTGERFITTLEQRTIDRGPVGAHGV